MNSKITFKKGLCGLVLLLFALFVSFVMSNHVYAEESDFVVDENGVLTKYNGTGGDVVIPDEVNGTKITSIGDTAFFGCEELISVKIPYGVTSIGKSVFSSCYNVITIEIPDSVTSIGDAAFSYCRKLSSIKLPKGISTIGASTFYECHSIPTIEIPDSVTSIGNSAFYGCDFETIEIPNSVTSIGGSAFYYCFELETVTMSDSVTSIMPSTFSGCESLKEINIPKSVTSIEHYAFGSCTSLTSINIPDSVTSIGYNAFYGSGLTTVDIPKGVVSIGNNAFSKCANLTSIRINNDNVAIGKDLADPNKVTFYCNKNSATEQYAKEYGYNFCVIGKPLTGISLQKTNINLTVGKTSLNSVIYNPTDTTDDKTVKWTSSNPEVVRVYTTGKVKGISKGTAVITAQVGEFTATCTVTVN